MSDRIEPFLLLNGGTAGQPLARPEPFSEHKTTCLFLEEAGPLKTVGAQWYACQDGEGTWRPTDRHAYRPLALRVINPEQRTERRVQGVLSQAESQRQVPGDSLRGFYYADEQEAVLVNCANGVLRVHGRAVSMLPLDPAHNFTSQAVARFDESARCDLFAELLGEALPDPRDRELLRLVCGTLLIPDSRFETALVAYGLAGTGKSTLFESITAALGGSLVSRLTMGQLCDPKGYHRPALKHSAVNLASELDTVEVDDGGTFKALCSGEAIEVRSIYGSPFIMRTSAKLIFLSNDLPRFKNGTDGELRRMRFLRFDRKPAVPDVTLKARLTAERDGIFRWMFSGTVDALSMVTLPHGGDASQGALSRFAVSNDPLVAFVGEYCELAPNATEKKAHLQEAYGQFLEEHGLTDKLSSWFFKRLYERYPAVKQQRARVASERQQILVGIRLKDDE